MIALGLPARWLFLSGVVIANIIANFTTNSPGEIFMFAIGNVAEPLIIAKLVEHHFGRNFSLGRTRDLLGLFAAALAGIIVSVTWYAIGYKLVLKPGAPSLTLWLDFFLGHVVGFVTIAPLVIGLFAALRDPPSGRELFEGVLGLIAVILLSAIIALLPPAQWDTVTPLALLLPILVWLAARCPPVFAAAAAFTLSMSIVWMTIFQFGHFGAASLSISDRILQIQAIILVTALAALILSALFAERKETEARLARTNATLQRERDNKLMSLRAVIASISHEVNQPLGAISMNGEATILLLDKKPPDIAEAKSIVTDILADGRRINETLDNLRALFGTADESKQSVDINALVLDVLRSSRVDCDRQGIKPTVELTSKRPTVVGHKGQLTELVSNLVQNAIEAMASVDEPRNLKVQTELAAGGAVIISVEDTGPGIGLEKIKTIFDVFVTTKSHGRGLGLAICSMIVERHNGHLSVSAARPHGCIFQIKLPSHG
jgi:signal transduction histidine kinase